MGVTVKAPSGTHEYRLTNSHEVLVLEPEDWHLLHDFSEHATVMCLCSELFDSKDYTVEAPTGCDEPSSVSSVSPPSLPGSNTSEIYEGQVPFIDVGAEMVAELRTELDVAYKRVVDSEQFILGKEVSAFEKECAGYFGVKYAVGVDSGTGALALAFRTLGIGGMAGGSFDDEVIIPPNAGSPTCSAVLSAGAVPVFVDVDPKTLLMDWQKVEAAVSDKTKCIVPIHLYGLAVNMEKVMEIATKHKLHVVEDCAQAFGTVYKGKKVGSFGDIGCMSFYPTKNLGALGDGGMCVTNNDSLYDRLRRLRQYGWDGMRNVEVLGGLNARLDEMQAAFLRVKLRRLEQSLSKRKELAKLYMEMLKGTEHIRLPAEADEQEGSNHTYHLFVVRVPRRDLVKQKMEEKGVMCGLHYGVSLNEMKAYKGTLWERRRKEGQGGDGLENSVAACASVLSLPFYVGMEPAKVRKVVETLKECVATVMASE